MNSIKLSWHRQDEETDKSWDAFVVYRNMGADRSLRKTQEQLGNPESYQSTLSKWSAQYDWVKRSAEYDNYQAMVLEQAALEHKKAQYVEAIEEYRQDNLNAGRRLFNISERFLTVLENNLDVLEAEELGISGMTAIAKIMCQLFEISSGMRSDALDIQGLAERLDFDED